MNADPNITPGIPLGTLPQPYHGGAVFIGRSDGAAAAERATATVDPRGILLMLWRWRWLILASLATALVLATVLTYLATPKYRATATIEIDQPEAQMASGGDSKAVAVRDPQFLTTQYGLLKSEALSDRIALSLGLASDERIAPQEASREDRLAAASATIRSNLEITPVDTSRLIKISFSGTDPAQAARIVNSLVDNFISMNLERRYEATASARNFLENRIATVKSSLEKSERELVGYAQRQGIVLVGADNGGQSSAAGTTSLDSSSLVAINEALAQAQNARIGAEQRYRQSQQLGTSTELVNNAGVQALNTERARLQAEYQQKLTRFKPDYPEMIELSSRISGLEKQVGMQTGSISNSLKGEFQAAAARERALQARVNQLKGAVLDLRNRSVQYNILAREVDTNRTLYDGLLQRYKEIGVAGGIGNNSASIVDRAKVPKAPYSPSLMLNLILAGILGLAASLGLVFLLEYLDDTVKTPDEVRTKLGLNMLGAVPLMDKKEVFFEALQAPDSPIAEAYSSVRAAIQFSTSVGAPPTMLITSSQAEEGKSSTSFAVAYNLSRLGARVLIIDADMRKPSFRVASGAGDGLSSILTGHAALGASLLSTQVDGLFLLPSGPVPPNPAELLSSDRMRALLKEVEGMFDHVVVDAPPLLALADATLLGALCHATIMVVEAGRTRRPAALAAIERLRGGGAKIIGVILTKFKATAPGYDYYNYSYGDAARKKAAIPLITQRLQ